MSEELIPGAYCHYSPEYGPKENGRIKTIGPTVAFVVFKCAGEWDKYENYTGQCVDIEDLKPGWHEQEVPESK